jgi:N-acyl-D-amino-acid deacylase
VKTRYLIKNSSIIDGSGNPAFNADVLVVDDRIIEVKSNITIQPDCKVIDATGLTLVPGFIDCHAHSDLSLTAAPKAEGKISQGITTEINGNCGLSAFPATELNCDHLQALYKRYNRPVNWNSFSEYAETINECHPAINSAFLVGHNSLRAAIRSYEEGEASATEITAMVELLRNCLDAGAAGLSLGLLYTPGCFADTDEIIALMRVAAEYEKVCTVHLRSESRELIEALLETIGMAGKAGIKRLHISHLKTGGKANWHKLPEVMDIISSPPTGMRITFDRYPYIESMTSLSTVLPEPYNELDDVSLQRELQAGPKLYKRILISLNQFDAERWRSVRLVGSQADFCQALFGQSLIDGAEKLGLTPAEFCLNILREDAVNAMAAFKGMSGRNMMSIIADARCCCGSDETARPFTYELGRSHPRGFGSFPKFFRLLHDAMSTERIIRKMTSLPAIIFQLRERGIIRPGYYADLVLIDPDEYASLADFSEPHTPATGVYKVWVNGQLSFDNQTVIGQNGRVVS